MIVTVQRQSFVGLKLHVITMPLYPQRRHLHPSLRRINQQLRFQRRNQLIGKCPELYIVFVSTNITKLIYIQLVAYIYNLLLNCYSPIGTTPTRSPTPNPSDSPTWEPTFYPTEAPTITPRPSKYYIISSYCLPQTKMNLFTKLWY